MKKIIVGLLILMISLFICSCNENEEEVCYESGYWYKYDGYYDGRDNFYELDLDEVIEYFVENISFADMVSYYGEDCMMEHVFWSGEYPHMYSVIEELEYAGCYDEIYQLYDIAEKAGFYPSAILGELFLDKSTNVIHATDGNCIDNMKISDRETIQCGFVGLEEEMNDNDKYLNDCVLCEKCMKRRH